MLPVSSARKQLQRLGMPYSMSSNVTINDLASSIHCDLTTAVHRISSHNCLGVDSRDGLGRLVCEDGGFVGHHELVFWNFPCACER